MRKQKSEYWNDKLWNRKDLLILFFNGIMLATLIITSYIIIIDLQQVADSNDEKYFFCYHGCSIMRNILYENYVTIPIDIYEKMKPAYEECKKECKKSYSFEIKIIE